MRLGEAFAAACEVQRILLAAGFETWFAGGCVRDHLLGLEPKDYDITTQARPEQVEQLFPRTVGVGKAFGVICVLMGPFSIEVATFRSEADYADGRHPDSIQFSDARGDVQRRDFTVNGLLWNPASDEIIDHVGGRKDLKRRIIRAIGNADERLDEDGLRLLRAVRFGTLGDFHLEAATQEAVARHADGLAQISPERMRDELFKIATHPGSRLGDAWRLLVDLGLAAHMLPLPAAGPPPSEACRVLDGLERRSLPLFLAVTLRRGLAPGSPPRAWRQLGEGVARDLRCSAQERSLLARLLEFRSRYRSLKERSEARQRLASCLPEAEEHEALLAAEGDAEDILQLLADQRARLGAELPGPLLNGKDLAAAGLPPGPLMGRKLRRVRWLQLCGRITDQESALAAARMR